MSEQSLGVGMKERDIGSGVVQQSVLQKLYTTYCFC
jgi:hypothetical protein